jgi:hypothetical protein
MDDNHMLIPDTAKTTKCGWIFSLQGFILDMDIQSAGEIFELDQKFFMVHSFIYFMPDSFLLRAPSPFGAGEGCRKREVVMKSACSSFTRSNPLSLREGQHLS